MTASALLTAGVRCVVAMFAETSGSKITCVASVDDTLFRPVCSYISYKTVIVFKEEINVST